VELRSSRTPDQLVRSQLLYPAELRAHYLVLKERDYSDYQGSSHCKRISSYLTALPFQGDCAYYFFANPLELKLVTKSFLFLLLLVSLIETPYAIAQSNRSIDEFVLSAMIRENIPGLSLTVIDNGEVITKSFGERRQGSGMMVHNDTIFEAASLSKPVFAYVVLRLEELGDIDLDLPLHNYLDDDSDFGADFFESEDYLKITARMVLNHSSGLPNGSSVPGAIYFEPGSQYAYSGTGFRYLHAAVEAITGKSLTQLLDEYLFGPLEMNDSSFLWRDDFQSNATWGHDDNGVENREILHLDQEFPEGGLVTSITDFTKFIQFILDEQAANNSLIAAMIEPTILARDYGDQGQMSWGLGWGIEQATLGNRLWHTGSNGVFKSFVLIDVDKQSALLFFANAENGLEIIPGLLEQTIGATGLSGVYQRTISESMRYPAQRNN
jgi:CubicO group peptidase (beta-lactamase class C family)